MTEPDDPGGPTPRVLLADEQDRVVDVAALERLAERALDETGVPEGHTLSIALVDTERITELKARYYGEDRATDVLSFAMDPLDAPPPAMLGDVVIGVEVAERQARGLGRSTQDEVEHLLVHGILHLAGFDHETDDDEVAMAREERRVLRAAAVPS
ncbi:MAG: rRNA maturation RNase YbeY [Actinobacteria bacterium]|nr:MAG: rRNA maturation RNase YbeY [Actinomycetota bacterium]